MNKQNCILQLKIKDSHRRNFNFMPNNHFILYMGLFEVLIYYASYNQERHGSCLQTINGYSNIVQGMIYHINMFFVNLQITRTVF
jgi:hypothetical protein